MKMTSKSYGELVQKSSPPSPKLKDFIGAFLIGGLICTVGQGVSTLAAKGLMLSAKDASAFTCVVMVFIGALLTGLGVYDVIGKYAGAGSIVPITGFANSMVSPALEYKREGYILGVGAKLFTVAGPVLVYGITASVAVGILYYIGMLLGWCGA